MSAVATGTAPAVIRKEPTPRLWSADEFSRMRELGIFAERDLFLDDGQLLEHFADGTSQAVTFTQADFCQLWDANFFRDQRVQLIGGEIVQESLMNPPHAVCVRKATRALERIFASGYDVRPQLPIDLTLMSRPHPDVAVVVGAIEDYAETHPTTAVLVVEVSDTTLEDDTHAKMSLYAVAGIAEYWVIDVTGGRVLVFRGPRPEQGQPFGFAYGSVSAHHRGDRISPLAIPDARVDVNDLLP
jgi:Uma2 family endonuclease